MIKFTLATGEGILYLMGRGLFDGYVISAVTAVTNPHHPIYPPKLQNQKTEYIKCKMNVAELFENLFLLESQQTSISDDGKVMYRDKIFNLRKK